MKLFPICSVGCPAKAASGTGAIAVYIYILKNLAYTLMIMMNDSTVMKRLPISVTAHSGILSKKPQSSIADTISLGSVILSKLPIPDAFMMVLTIPCTISKSAIISSSPYVTTPFAIANLMKSFRACSGFFTSAKLPQVFTTPTTKKRTSSASPIAISAPCMSVITFHIAPPLKSSGDCVSSFHTSASLSFHVFKDFCRFCTTQLSDMSCTSSHASGFPFFITSSDTLYRVLP